MADELIHSGICGEKWRSNRNMFDSSSLCSSSTISDVGGVFGWSNINLFDDMKTSTIRSTDESLLLLHHQDVNNVNESLDSTTTTEWNEALMQTNESSHQSSYPIMLQDDFNLDMNNYHHHQQQHRVMEFCPKTYLSDQESSNSTTFKSSALNQNYSLEQQMNSDFTSTSEGLPTNYPLNSSSSCDYSSTFLENLFSDDTTTIQKPLFENHQSTNFQQATPSSAGIDNSFLTNSMNDFSMTKQAPLAFSNNTSPWNASAATINDIRAGVLPSRQQPQVPSSSVQSFSRSKASRPKANIEEGAKMTNDEQAFKRPRIETPSSLPTFKVRKEKLGDRITALQQLVSPFGKTDTASVLHEAIEYIKFLHDQVNVLSTPYMKNGFPGQGQQGTEEHEQDQDLRSRGLCLVPLSSTFSLAAEPPTDFWTPTLGGAFRSDKWEAWNGGSHIALACKF
ncbi:basic helix-loop-helix transcription factor [Lithospermum erythrorhizon]|uniref:Basic helix-loop-helix transcription factor n=1 Tax=Lithospermum erythrorhizon TaxID=34254 RepID=A0AAV3P3L7_LITER